MTLRAGDGRGRLYSGCFTIPASPKGPQPAWGGVDPALSSRPCHLVSQRRRNSRAAAPVTAHSPSRGAGQSNTRRASRFFCVGEAMKGGLEPEVVVTQNSVF